MRNVPPNAHIVGEFLFLDPHLASVWAVEISTKHTSSPDEALMSLNFPAFDGGHVAA
jgi:hypothetical protein